MIRYTRKSICTAESKVSNARIGIRPIQQGPAEIRLVYGQGDCMGSLSNFLLFDYN